jgi:hypothetical protein
MRCGDHGDWSSDVCSSDLSSDAEGNSYSPLAGYATVCYVAETPYSGEIYDEESAEEMEVNFIENAVALWPTN